MEGYEDYDYGDCDFSGDCDYDDTTSETDSNALYKYKDDWKYLKHCHRLEFNDPITKISNNLVLPTDTITFSYKLASRMVLQTTDYELIRKFRFLYEIVNNAGLLRIYMDIDKCCYSYNDILQLCNDFIGFLSSKYNYTNEITFRIHISILPAFASKTFSPTDKRFESIHIIFNVLVNDIAKIKQVVVERFMKAFPQYKIDPVVYTKNKKFRTLFQSKEKKLCGDKEPSGKTLYALKYDNSTNTVEIDNEITHADFINYVMTPTTESDTTVIYTTNEHIKDKHILTADLSLYFNVELEAKIVELKFDYNIIYSVNQIQKCITYISKLESIYFTNTRKWKCVLKLCIFILHIAGIEWNAIPFHDLITVFLTKSRVESYNTTEFYQKNIAKVKFYCDEKIICQHYHNTFFEPLKEKEIRFIYKSLNIPIDTALVITLLDTDTATFLKITNTNTNTNSSYLYNQKNQMLLLDYKLTTIVSPTPSNPDKTKTIVLSNMQKQFAIEEIKEEPAIEIKDTTHTIINVKALGEIPINCNSNSYTTAPVGSGKSVAVMSKDILCILDFVETHSMNAIDITKENAKQLAIENYNKTAKKSSKISKQPQLKKPNPHYRILVITDTISLATKQFKDIQTLVKTTGYNEEIVFYYKTTKYKITADTRIVVCCYDSILKFKQFNPTHVIIDEMVNVSKRFSATQRIGEDKTNLINYFFTLCQHSILKLYDADIEFSILYILKKKYNVSITIYNLIDFVQRNKNIVLSTDDLMRQEIIDLVVAGKNVSISGTSCNFLKTLNDDLLGKNIKPQIFVSRLGASISNEKNDIQTPTLNKKIVSQLSSKTELWENYQVFIYSPVFTTGISFNNPSYFYKHFHFISSRSCDAIQNAQMIYRVRANETFTIVVSIINNKLGTLKNVVMIDTTADESANYSSFVKNINNPTELLSYKKIINSSSDDELLLNPKLKSINNIVIDIKKSDIELINSIEKFQYDTKIKRLFYDFFKTVKKYGSPNIECRFFEKFAKETTIETNESIILQTISDMITTIETETQPTKKTYTTQEKIEDAYNNAVYLFDFQTTSIANDADKFNIELTFAFKKYNISYECWSYSKLLADIDDVINNTEKSMTVEIKANAIMQLISDCCFKTDYLDFILKKCNDKQIDDLVKKSAIASTPVAEPTEPTETTETTETTEPTETPVAETATATTATTETSYNFNPRIHIHTTFNEYDDTLGSKSFIFNHTNTFNHICNVSYYEVKHVIYAIFENWFHEIPSKSELTKPTVWHDKLQICLMKPRDFQKIINFIYGLYVSFKIFDLLQITQQQIEELYFNKTTGGIVFSKKQLKIDLTELFQKTNVLFEYVLNINGVDKYKTDLQFRQQLTTALNLLALKIEVGETTDEFAIITTKEMYHYRFQQTRLRDDVGTNQNDLDDLHYWLKTDFYELPKVMLYNANESNLSPINHLPAKNKKPKCKNASAEWLRYIIDFSCSEQLPLLQETNVQIKNKFIDSTAFVFIEKSENSVLQTIESVKSAIATEKQALEQEKEDAKKAKKVEKAESKVNPNEKFVCEICNGTFTLKNITTHKSTKKHQTAVIAMLDQL